MSPCYKEQTIMSDSDEYYSSDNNGNYSDTDLSDEEELGDRDQEYAYNLSKDDALNETILQDEVDTIKYLDSILQHPNDMHYILPARKSPSIDEMNMCYACFVREEQTALKKASAVPILEKWWLKCMKLRTESNDKKKLTWKQNHLREWKSLQTQKVAILRLGPLTRFQDEYDNMISINKIEALKIKAEKDKKLAIESREKYSLELIRLQKEIRKRGIAIGIKNKGMNKNTSWHKERRAGSLAIKGKCVEEKKESGTGRRAIRKISLEKRKNDDILLSKRIPEFKVDPIPVVEEEEEEELDDETKIRLEEEKKEEEDESMLIKSLILSSLVKKEYEERVFFENKLIKSEENKELVEFAERMGRSIKSSNVNKKSQKIITTKATRRNKKVLLSTIIEPPKIFSKENMEIKLTCTTLCNSVFTKRKCTHKFCRFAHSIDELKQKDCGYGTSCRFIKHIGNGQFENIFQQGKKCHFVHPSENKNNYCKRMGLTSPPKLMTFKSEPVIVEPNVVKVSNIKIFVSKYKPVVFSKKWSDVVSESLIVKINIKTEKETNDLVNDVVLKIRRVITPTEITPTEITPTEITPTEITPTEITPTEITPTEITPTEITRIKKRKFTPVEITIDISPKKIKKLKITPIEKEKVKAYDYIMEKVFSEVSIINKKILDKEKSKREFKRERKNKIETIDNIQEKKIANEKSFQDLKEAKRLARRSYRKSKATEKLQVISPSKTVLIKVKKEQAKNALISAIRNGLTDFKIEIIK